MNFKYLSASLVAMVAATLASCYSDDGNYDYTSLPDVKIEMESQYYVTQFDTLNIPVSVDLDGDDASNYEYSWRLWSNEIKRSDYRKTIADSRDLSFKADELAGSYTLVLTVHNKKTDVNTYKQASLSVQGALTEGWMVLHEKDGVTDFDLIMTPFFSNRVKEDEVVRNVYQMNGEQLQGKGRCIGSYIDTQRQYVTILTDKGGAKLEATTMQKAFDMATLMPDITSSGPQSYVYYSYRGTARAQGFDAIINGDKLYFYNVFGSRNFTSYTEPIQKDGLTYTASPYVPKYIWASYYGMGIIIYDELNGRFLYVDKNYALAEMPDASTAAFDWNNMHAHLRYMKTGFNNHDFGLFEDWDTHKLTLYEFNFDEKQLNKAILKKYPADAAEGLANAKYYAIGERGPIFYYADDRNIRLFDYSGSGTSSIAYTLANANEKITGIKILKPCASFSRTVKINHDYNNRVIFVSTHNATSDEGKIYMYYFNESNGQIDLASEKVFGGFGEILDMDYNWPKYGT